MKKQLKPVQVQFKPTIFCLGVVTEVGDAKQNEKGTVSVEIKFAHKGSAPAFPNRFWVSFVPGALGPENLEKSRMFLYENNVARGFLPSTKPSKIFNPGLASFNQWAGYGKCDVLFGDKLAEVIGEYQDNSPTEGSLSSAYLLGGDEYLDAIDDHFSTLIGKKFGYILKQQWMDTGETNEKGYAVKVPGGYYEFSGMFPVTEECIEQIAEVVEDFNNYSKTNKAFCAFDTTKPFDLFNVADDIPF